MSRAVREQRFARLRAFARENQLNRRARSRPSGTSVLNLLRPSARTGLLRVPNPLGELANAIRTLAHFIIGASSAFRSSTVK